MDNEKTHNTFPEEEEPLDTHDEEDEKEIKQKYSSPSQPLPRKHRVLHLNRLRKKRRLGPLGIALIAFLALLLLGCGALTAGYLYYRANLQPALQNFTRPVSRSDNEPPLPESYQSIQGRAWNILLLGSDNDAKFTFPNVLTQVMMVVRVDTVNNSISMVSIPRDSWVTISEVGGMHKIDQAFLLGSQKDQGFEGGVRLARQTIEQDYGIPIDRYAWVGLDGFAKVIDTLGGVDIDVTHPIVDDTYPDDASASQNGDAYAYKRLYLQPGPQHLNGEQALEYVRSRHSDLLGDIGRTMRQQEVLDGLKRTLDLSNVLNNLSELLKDMQGKLYTDLNEQEMLAFANYGRTLSGNAISRLTLGPGEGANNFGSLDTVYDSEIGANQSVVVPDCETIQPVVNRVFGLGNVQSCNVTGENKGWW
jgi:LCP family protein required for cell wall assembly